MRIYDIYGLSTDIIQKTRGIFFALKRELTIIYRRSADEVRAFRILPMNARSVSVCTHDRHRGCVKCVDYAATQSA